MIISPGIRYMFYAAFFFALMNVCVKMLQNIPASEIVFFRAIVTLVMTGVVLWRLRIPFGGNNKKYLFLRGLTGSIGMYLYYYTVQEMPLATAVTFQYLSPIFATVFAVFVLSERAKWMQWLFFAISFSGIIFIQGFDPRVTLLLAVVGIIAAMFSGMAYTFIRKLKDFDNPLVVVFYFPLVTIPLVTPVLIYQWVTPSGWEWLLLLLTGVFTQYGQVYMTRAFQADTAATVSIMKYLGVVYALFFGYFVFGESFTFWSYSGMFLIISGVVGSVVYKHFQAKKQV